jgi:ABC-type Na+ efflux pump permease subunit
MSNILTIARREITRLRTSFKGGARPVVLLILTGSFLVAYLAFRQGAVQGKGLYRAGVSPDGPPIQDSRFDPITVVPSDGYAMLESGAIDVYVDGARVAHRDEEKSLYAISALKLYLEKQELARIENSYKIEQGFPLRIEVNYFPIDLTTDDREIIIPSLMNPPMPFAHVVTVSLYLLPVFFVSVFFTSGFMNEKIDRRITVLLSAPVSPFQIISGKMLPYMVFALVSVVVLTLVLGGKPLLAAAIFFPVILFTFSIYLMVPLVYRTFKDTTFISMLATTVVTSYLVFPAMFSGVSDLSFMSPLTLAVKMHREQPFGLKEYLTSTAPMYLVFILAIYVGSRMLNEEYLMKFRPLYRKAAEALYLAIDRSRLHISIMLLSLLLIPLVYMIQLATLAISLNLPIRFAIGALLVMSVIIEEVSKSAGIAVLIENEDVKRARDVITLSFFSALGFLAGEKLLLFVSIGAVSEASLSAALLSSGKLWIPLLAHSVFTAIVCLLTKRFSTKRYPHALLIGSAIHVLYNLYVLGLLIPLIRWFAGLLIR